MRIETIKLTKKERESAEAFADARCGEDQALYKKRGGFKREDIVVGAMAEIGVYKLLRKYGFKVNKPDFKIYEKRNKSYEADLMDAKRHFHVKGQSLTSAKRYGNSWLFQRSDKLINSPIKNNYIVPCEVDHNSGIINIFGIVSSTAVHNYQLMGECSVPMFRTYKQALYLESVNFLTRKAKWGLLQKNGKGNKHI